MMTQNEVLAIVDGERNYQDWIWQQRAKKAGVPPTPDSNLLPEDWLIFIRGYYNEAVQEAAHCVEETVVLDIIRKLAGLCVACMESNGCWNRCADGVFGDFHEAPVSRNLVYHAISTERAYQNALSELRTDGRFHCVNGYLVMFGDYLNEAFHDWTRRAGHEKALQAIGKLAGIAVHCMEDHGAPRRVVDHRMSSNTYLFQRIREFGQETFTKLHQNVPWRKPWRKPCKKDH